MSEQLCFNSAAFETHEWSQTIGFQESLHFLGLSVHGNWKLIHYFLITTITVILVILYNIYSKRSKTYIVKITDNKMKNKNTTLSEQIHDHSHS